MDDYSAHISEIIRVIRDTPAEARQKWPSAGKLAEALQADEPSNFDLFDFLDSRSNTLRITGKQLAWLLTQRVEAEVRTAAKLAAKLAANEAKEAARRAVAEAKELAKQKAQEAKELAKRKVQEAKEHSKQQAANDLELLFIDRLGSAEMPVTEREYVRRRLEHRGITMGYDRSFKLDGKSVRAEEIGYDLRLTAAELCLTKPHGDVLNAGNIELAWAEWTLVQRQLEMQKAIDSLMAAPSKPAAEVRAQFLEFCRKFFKEPEFACACILKIIHQVKCGMLNITVLHRMMLLIIGRQHTGKSEFERVLCHCIESITTEASLKDVLDERQMDLCSYPLIRLDEMVAADRTDFNALKNFITGADWARRPMRTNVVEKVKVRATLIGTSNLSLGQLIFDATGMRRFVEVEVLDREDQRIVWETDVEQYNWLDLWRSVSPYEADPLLNQFPDELKAKQEALRNAENCELWLRQFVPYKGLERAGGMTAEYAEYFAQELYAQFRIWEEQYDPAWRGTSLQRWGRQMKGLIDTKRIAGWRHHMLGPKTVYVREHQPTDEHTKVVPLRPRYSTLNE